MSKVKNAKKDRNKNCHSLDVQSLGQFKNLDRMPGFEHPELAHGFLEFNPRIVLYIRQSEFK